MGLYNIFVLALSASTLIKASQIPLTLPAFDPEFASTVSSARQNAPDIFNAVFGAMRRWSSAINHNGMSFYPVTIPADTLFYHGRETPEPAQGLEWLAFDIYFAELFARFNPRTLLPLDLPFPMPGEEFVGYLHTYKTTRPLTKVLYIDGQSAAKSFLGTLDSQDNVLLRNSSFRSKPGFEDGNRAAELCAMFPGLEGIVRMVIGFELILCDFSSSVEIVNANKRPSVGDKGNLREKQVLAGESMRGISERFSKIGGNGVSVDYSSMVSAYFYQLNLANPDPERKDLPRINPEEGEELEKMRSDVLEALQQKKDRKLPSFDWQSITDMIVAWYSDRLAYIANDDTGRSEMINTINFLSDYYIDFNTMDLKVAQESCKAHYLLGVRLQTRSDQLIYQAMSTVMEKICTVLFDVRRELRDGNCTTIDARVKLEIKQLMGWLRWSSWRECGKCESNEVCYVAIWPWGKKIDHERPGCVDVLDIFGRSGYWDYNLGNIRLTGRD